MHCSDEPQTANSATKNPADSASHLGIDPQQAQPAIQPPETRISWAAATSKGLPPSENPAPMSSSSSSHNGGSSSSKHFEMLNSVRKALFSQDGWGSNNVKQDTPWNIEGMDSHSLRGDDGTELWKSTLSGQPPVAKPLPSTSWHTPQNPTDYKQWGEDDDTFDSPGGAFGGRTVGACSSNYNQSNKVTFDGKLIMQGNIVEILLTKSDFFIWLI